jgi:hypothetical protein
MHPYATTVPRKIGQELHGLCQLHGPGCPGIDSWAVGLSQRDRGCKPAPRPRPVGGSPANGRRYSGDFFSGDFFLAGPHMFTQIEAPRTWPRAELLY